MKNTQGCCSELQVTRVFGSQIWKVSGALYQKHRHKV